jgi:uncharacterized protein YcgI (DUF1989 family)
VHSELAPGEWHALALVAGSCVRIEALVDEQAVEVVAHAAEDPRERLSTLVTALAENVHEPVVGTRLWSQDYRSLLRVVEQTHSRHDLMLEACNPWLRSVLENEADGASCWANFREALGALGLGEKWIPYPFGVFRQAGERDGGFGLLAPSSRAGDQVTLEVERDLTLIASACPVGAPDVRDGAPTVRVEVLK